MSATGGSIAAGSIGHLHVGDINLHTGAPIRSRYRIQVERISSGPPLDRDAELAELAEFCTDARQSGAYRWWRAPAWSGKTTLLSWFVLNPPPKVRIVSFFVTARLAAQSDRGAFVDTVLEQLLDMLGEPAPYLTDATRDGHLLGLLADAARNCEERGEQFVLVVDGLDEDRGVVAGPGAHSIAALLPAHLPSGMRVIVAGRPNPPIPDDVPADHPLRDATVVRELSVSPHAQARERELTQDLHDLLTGTDTGQDLVGLLIASGGGVSADDLCELTGLSPRQVAARLDTVTGRVFDRRASRWRRTDGYLLGHEELQQAAVADLTTSRIVRYRKRLHAWADGYRERGWPAGTPDYLLDGYVAMLTVRGNLRRAVEFVTDSARHDRMQALSGADAAALTEVRSVARRLAELNDPDLALLGRVVVHRDHLLDRNSHVPAELLPVWFGLGQFDRAENLAGTLANTDYPGTYSNPHDNVHAAIELALAAGQDARAQRLVDKAEELARGITSWGPEMGVTADPWAQSWALARVAGAMVALGQQDRADAVGSDLFTPEATAMVLTHRVRGALAAGEYERADRLLAEAEAFVRTLDFDKSSGHREQTQAWLGVAGAMVALGQPDRAVDFVHDIPSGTTMGKVNAYAGLAEVLAASGAAEQARRLVADAEARIDALDRPDDRALFLARLAAVAGDTGDRAWAGELVAAAETCAYDVAGTRERASALAKVAEAAVTVGEIGRARRLAGDAVALGRTFDDSAAAVEVLADVAEVVGAVGDHRRAEDIATAIRASEGQAWVLARLANRALRRGEHDLARRLAVEAEARARAGSAAGQRLTAPRVPMVSALVDIGDHDSAELLARTIAAPTSRARMLGTVAAAVAPAGDHDRAHRLVAEAEEAISAVRAPHDPAYTLGELAAMMATAGVRPLARRLATEAEDLMRTTKKGLAARLLAELWAGLGEAGRAEAVARRFPGRDNGEAAFAAAAAGAAAVGRHDDALRLAAPAEAAVRAVRNPATRARLLCELAATVIARRTPSAVHPSWSTITIVPTTPEQRAYARRLVNDALVILNAVPDASMWWPALTLAALGEFHHARMVANSIPETHAGNRVELLSELAQLAADAGDHTHADGLLADAVSSLHDYMSLDGTSLDLVRATLAVGRYDRAELLTAEITDPIWRARALAYLAEEAAATGRLDRLDRALADAHTIISGIADPITQYEELAGLLHHIKNGADRCHADQLPAALALRARRLLAEALLSTGWHKSLRAMAFASPRALTAMAQEILTVSTRA